MSRRTRTALSARQQIDQGRGQSSRARWKERSRVAGLLKAGDSAHDAGPFLEELRLSWNLLAQAMVHRGVAGAYSTTWRWPFRCSVCIGSTALEHFYPSPGALVASAPVGQTGGPRDPLGPLRQSQPHGLESSPFARGVPDVGRDAMVSKHLASPAPTADPASRPALRWSTGGGIRITSLPTILKITLLDFSKPL